MDLNQLANLGEFIGGIAVLVTLIYLAVQIRQNTKALRTSTYAQAVAPMYGVAEQTSKDGEFAEIALRGFNAFDTLTELEKFRFQNWAGEALFAYENLYRAFEAGQISEDALYNAFDNVAPFFRGGLAEVAANRQGPTSKRFLVAFEDRLRAIGALGDAAS